jgi:colicin import membrane protein
MGGVANLALQALPVIASAQKTVNGFQSANDTRYAAQLDAQQRADTLAFEKQKEAEQRQSEANALAFQRQKEVDALAFEKQKTADALALEREKIAASQKELADQKQHAEQVLRESQSLQQRQLLQDQATADRAQQADIATRRAQIETSAASDEAARLKALRKTVGRTRASLGAGGGGTSDGSGEAVLLGLVADTNQSQQEADATDRLRSQALAQEVTDTQKRNLLERSQLAEKQRLELFSNAY